MSNDRVSFETNNSNNGEKMMSTIIASTIVSKLVSATFKLAAGILAVCVALVGWHLNWDYSRIGTLPVVSNIVSAVSVAPSQDVVSVRENLVSQKNDLLQQQDAQLREQAEGAEREADLEARRDKLARDIVEAEKTGSTIRFAQRTLSIGDGKEQLRKLGKALVMAAEKREFRANVLSQIEAKISEVSEEIARAERAISVKDVAGILRDLEKNKKETAPIVAKGLEPFDVSFPKGGVLTEEELFRLPSQPQTASQDDTDIESLLNQYRIPTPVAEKDMEVRRVKGGVKIEVFK